MIFIVVCISVTEVKWLFIVDTILWSNFAYDIGHIAYAPSSVSSRHTCL
jgi:hypothetical protein